MELRILFSVVVLPRKPKNVAAFKTELETFSLKHRLSANLENLDVLVSFSCDMPEEMIEATKSELWEILHRNCPGLKRSNLFPEGPTSPENRASSNPILHQEHEALASIYTTDFEAWNDYEWVVKVGSDTHLRVQLPAGYPHSEPPIVSVECPRGTAPKVQRELENCWSAGSEGCVFQMVEILRAAVDAMPKLDTESGAAVESPGEEPPVKPEVKVSCDVQICHGETLADRSGGFSAALLVGVVEVCVGQIDRCLLNAHVALRVHTSTEVEWARNKLLSDKRIKGATHNVVAWRFRQRRPNKLVEDYDDDGEKEAGKKLLDLLQLRHEMDVMVMVSRWRGVVHLGFDRFRDYNKAAQHLLENMPEAGACAWRELELPEDLARRATKCLGDATEPLELEIWPERQGEAIGLLQEKWQQYLGLSDGASAVEEERSNDLEDESEEETQRICDPKDARQRLKSWQCAHGDVVGVSACGSLLRDGHIKYLAVCASSDKEEQLVFDLQELAATDDIQKLYDVLPEELRTFLDQRIETLKEDKGDVVEIALDIGREMEVRWRSLEKEGLQIDDVGCKVTKDHFSHILKHVGEEPMFYEQFHEFLPEAAHALEDPACEEAPGWSEYRSQLMALVAIEWQDAATLAYEWMNSRGMMKTKIMDEEAKHCLPGVIASLHLLVRFSWEEDRSWESAVYMTRFLSGFASSMHPDKFDEITANGTRWPVTVAEMDSIRRSLAVASANRTTTSWKNEAGESYIGNAFTMLGTDEVEPGISMKNSVRVYVYDVEDYFELGVLARGASFCRENQWGFEVGLHEWFLACPCRTEDPLEADFFFVPHYTACHLNVETFSEEDSNALFQSLVGRLQHFPRSDGRDHLFVWGGGFGVDGPFRSWRRYIEDAIFLMTETELWNPYQQITTPGFSAWKDVLIPGRISLAEVRWAKSAPTERQYLADFVGWNRPLHNAQGGMNARHRPKCSASFGDGPRRGEHGLPGPGGR
eukprot:g32206.t1